MEEDASSTDVDEQESAWERAESVMLAPVVAQALGPELIVGLLVVTILVLAGLFFAYRRMQQDKQIEEEERPELEEGEKPTEDLLEEREELDEPVDDYEDMSLAEVKKAKMARVSKKGEKRATAGEATEEAREEHQEVEVGDDEGAPLSEFEKAEDEPAEEEGEGEAEEASDDETSAKVEKVEHVEEVEEPAEEEEAEEDDEAAEAEEENEAEADEEASEAEGEAEEETDEGERDEEGESGLASPNSISELEPDVDDEDEERRETEEASEDEDDSTGGPGLGGAIPSPTDLKGDEEESEEVEAEPEAADEAEGEGEPERAAAEDGGEVEAAAEEAADEDVADVEEDEKAEEAADEDVEGVEEDKEVEEEKTEEDAQVAGEEADEEAAVAEEPDDEKADEQAVEEAEQELAEEEADEDDQYDPEAEPKSFEKGLEKTREGLFDQLSSFFTGEKLDPEMVEEVEKVLFQADIGPRVAQDIIDAIEEHLSGEELEDPGKVWGFIRHYTEELLSTHEEALDASADKPYVVLVVGVNGVGKTTTIGKMASRFKREGKSSLLVAGDTFRAGAVDQLGIWAERTGLPMHRGEEGADPASVIYEGVEKAEEEDHDIVLCDTSGRLHTDKNLMEELKKMERVAGKARDGAPHEVHLVLDANTGQNAIAQAEKFDEALDVTGMTLTKFDGTARGGVILGVCKRFDAPVRYVGIGERVVDLREFHADEFTEALFM